MTDLITDTMREHGCSFPEAVERLAAASRSTMMSNVIVNLKETAISRPLHVLVPLIQKDLEQGKQASERAGMPYYQAAGEKMLEAKNQMKHGEFEPWIKRNFDISPQHARRYMSFARATSDTENARARSFSSFSEFMREEGGDPGYGKVVRKQDWQLAQRWKGSLPVRR